MRATLTIAPTLGIALLALGLILAPSAAWTDSSAVRATKPERAKPVVEKRLVNPGQAPRYKCETEGGSTECTCSGIIDCKAMIDSGDCGSSDVWEDSDDPSKGGCG